MKRNPIMPFVVIMVVGVLAMFLISFKGIGDSKQLAEEMAKRRQGPTNEQVASKPEGIYQQSCIAVMVIPIRCGVGPAINRCVGDRLSRRKKWQIFLSTVKELHAGRISTAAETEAGEVVLEMVNRSYNLTIKPF